MVTTIQISDKTKEKLHHIKQTQNRTYDEIVMSLLREHGKKVLREQAADYYSKYADDDLAEVEEFADEKW